jgi:hypothetical protein
VRETIEIEAVKAIFKDGTEKIIAISATIDEDGDQLRMEGSRDTIFTARIISACLMP